MPVRRGRVDATDLHIHNPDAVPSIHVVTRIKSCGHHGVRKKDGGRTVRLLPAYFWLGRVVFARRRTMVDITSLLLPGIKMTRDRQQGLCVQSQTTKVGHARYHVRAEKLLCKLASG